MKRRRKIRKAPLNSFKVGFFSALSLVVLLVAVFACVQCRQGWRPVPPGAAPGEIARQALRLSEFDDGCGIFAGEPRSSVRLKILKNHDFANGYDEQRKCPLWTTYRVTGMARYQSLERPGSFRVDDRTEARVAQDDYTHTGYDRGHMAPNYAIYSRYGREAQLDTFFMSNVCPQRPSLNRGRWRELESKIAGSRPADTSWAQKYQTVWVATGPVFDINRSLMNTGVEIPDAFYMIILDVDESYGTLRVMAFLLPNDRDVKETLQTFLVSVDEVEMQTGLDFYSDLDDSLEIPLESQKATALWN